MTSISTLLGLQGLPALPLTILCLRHYIFFHVLLFIFFSKTLENCLDSDF